MASNSHLPLNLSHAKRSTLIINRLYILFHSMVLTLLIYYRASSLLTKPTPFIPHLVIFISELVGSILRLFSHFLLWRPVTRTAFPERLPADQYLPPIDVFICTADPQKEPLLGVMNTLLSAMALNYPPLKLTVYLSDDGGCEVTLEAMREAWKFGNFWVPFCNKYGVKTICPQAYFTTGEDGVVDSDEFRSESLKVQEEYEKFAQKVTKMSQNESCKANYDHASIVEVIGNKSLEENTHDQRQLPLLVYVSREKKPSHPSHFKAGALNSLLRVSSMISNSPYILGLDCDMYCNDSDSARQAMCFHLDPKLSSSLAFVQFPQNFHNLSKYDIYNIGLTATFQTCLPGMDGIKGPCLLGTCYYLKREPLYGFSPMREEINLMELRQSFGSSNEFIKSLHQKYNVSHLPYDEMLQETKLLASCAYEKDTEWGKEVGFRYFTVVEDIFTSFNIHCKNWISVFYMPPRPSFLGSATISLNAVLIQSTRYIEGLTTVAMSRFSPFVYGPSRMSVFQSICYGSLFYSPLLWFPTWVLATIPQLCFFNGTAIYPEVTSSFFRVLLFEFILTGLYHTSLTLSTGAPFQTGNHEQRLLMINGITCYFYGSMHTIMEKLGGKQASFLPTNKVINNDEEKLYQMGIYNFQTSSMFLVPPCSLVILNLVALVVGVVKVIFQRNYNEMCVQIFISLFIVKMSSPILEGMMFRKDKGRIPTSITCYSLVLSVVILSFGLFVVAH